MLARPHLSRHLALSTRTALWAMLLYLSGNAQLTSQTQFYSQILADWKHQDSVESKGLRNATASVIASLPASKRGSMESELARISDQSAALEALYTSACSARRESRMGPYLSRMSKIIYTVEPMRGAGWFMGSEPKASFEGKGLELLEMKGGTFGTVTHLLPKGSGRDADVSFDGQRILFAWAKGPGGKNFQVFEMNLADRTTRQITQGGALNYEPIYLQNGDIMFHSDRQIQGIDCVGGQVQNLYTCDLNGRYTRRLGFDQVHTNSPRLLPTGEVVFARWDYNDKSHVFGHALFTMNPDGTRQQEYYNNNSLFPTCIQHARPIPGTNKIMAIISGYHKPQLGLAVVVDNSIGMQNGLGLTIVAPVRQIRDLPAELFKGQGASANVTKTLYAYTPGDSFPYPNGGPRDGWGGDKGFSNTYFAFPYPLDENAFLATHRPDSLTKETGLYFLLMNGQRELLAADPDGWCSNATVVAPRPVPPRPSSTVDYRDSMGVFQIMNIYEGQSLRGVTPGTVKRLRIVALDYRTGPTIGASGHRGVVSLGSYNNPIAVGNASWDVKVIVGETPVLEDGSANFLVPARTPVYFQALDGQGEVVQTMRSWATLMPGETFSCVGCHDSKLIAPHPPSSVPLAVRQPPRRLDPFYGPMRGFSFTKEIQPILDAKCVKCHSSGQPNGINLEGKTVWIEKPERSWPISYLNLVKRTSGSDYAAEFGGGTSSSSSKYVSWFHAEDSPLLQAPYRAGSCKSMLVSLLETGHKEVSMSKEEMDKIRCWIDLGIPCMGDYAEGTNDGAKSAIASNLAKRKLWVDEEAKNIQAWIAAGQKSSPVPSLMPPGSGAAPENRLQCSINSRRLMRVTLPASLRGATDQMELTILTLQGRTIYRTTRFQWADSKRHTQIDCSRFGTGQVMVRLTLPKTSYMVMKSIVN